MSVPRHMVGKSGAGRLAMLIVCVLLATPRLLEACAVCFGNPDSPHTQGMNNAILFLLVIVGGVLVCFAAFFLSLVRRSKLARAGEFAGLPGRAPDASSGANGTRLRSGGPSNTRW